MRIGRAATRATALLVLIVGCSSAGNAPSLAAATPALRASRPRRTPRPSQAPTALPDHDYVMRTSAPQTSTGPDSSADTDSDMNDPIWHFPTRRPRGSPAASPTQAPSKPEPLEAPSMASSATLTLANGLTVKFAEPTDRAAIAGFSGVGDCSTWFAPSNAFGQRPECRFVDPFTLIIRCDAYARVRVGHFVFLRRGYVRAADASSDTDLSATGRIEVRLGGGPIEPVIRLFAPSQVQPNATIILDASGSTGAGGRPFDIVMWSMRLVSKGQDFWRVRTRAVAEGRPSTEVTAPANAPSSPMDDGGSPIPTLMEAHAFIDLRKFATDDSFLVLHIPAQELDIDEYAFDLTLTNYLGGSSTAKRHVKVSAEPIPTIHIQGGDLQWFEPRGALIELASQFDLSGLAAAELTTWLSGGWEVSWQIDPHVPLLPRKDPMRVALRRNELVPGTPYRAQVTAARRFAHVNGTIEQVELVDSATFGVGLDNPVAIVAGGSRRVDVSSELVLDGTASFDPSSSAPLDFAWECNRLVVSQGRPTTTPCGFEIPARAVVELSPNTLRAEESYAFQLTVGSGGSDWARTGTSEPIYIVTTVSPVIQVQVALEHSGQGRVVNGHEPLRVRGRIWPMRPSTQCEFREVEHDLDLEAEQVSASPSSGRGLGLVIRPHVLEKGKSYTFALECHDGLGLTGFGLSETVQVNVPPSGGTLGVAPQAGTAGVTHFDLRAPGWIDDDGQLRYSFHYLRLPFSSRRDVHVSSGSSVFDADRVTLVSVLDGTFSTITIPPDAYSVPLRPLGADGRATVQLPMACTWEREPHQTDACDLVVVVRCADQNGGTAELATVVTVTRPNKIPDGLFDLSDLGAEESLRSLVNAATLLGTARDWPVQSEDGSFDKLLSGLAALVDMVDLSDERAVQVIEALDLTIGSTSTLDQQRLDLLYGLLEWLVRSLDVSAGSRSSDPQFGKFFVSDHFVHAISSTLVVLSSKSEVATHAFTRDIVQRLGRAQAARMIPGEAAAQVTTPLFSVYTARRSGYDLANATDVPVVVEIGSSRFELSAPVVEGDAEVDLFSMDWGLTDPWEGTEIARPEHESASKQNRTGLLLSPVVEFSVLNSSTGEKLQLPRVNEEAAYPALVMTLARRRPQENSTEWLGLERDDNNNTELREACGFFDEEEEAWSEYGCFIVESDDSSIVCACNHTTDFSAWATTTDVFEQVISGQGFVAPEVGPPANKWAIIVALAALLVLCVGLAMVGSILDRRDAWQYQRAMRLLLLRRAIIERSESRKAFEQWKLLHHENLRLSRTSLTRKRDTATDLPDDASAPGPATVASRPLGGGSPAAMHEDGLLWSLKLRCRLFGYFLLYDPVFNRLHRALILTSVVLGKLFTSALFFHFYLDDGFHLYDRVFVVLINTVFFSIFAVICTAIFMRIPPIPGSRWRFNMELQRLCRITNRANKRDRQALFRMSGLDVSAIEASADLETKRSRLCAQLAKASRVLWLRDARAAQSRKQAKFGTRLSFMRSSSPKPRSLLASEDGASARSTRSLDALERSVRRGEDVVNLLTRADKLARAVHEVDPALHGRIVEGAEAFYRAHRRREKQLRSWLDRVVQCCDRRARRERREAADLVRRLAGELPQRGRPGRRSSLRHSVNAALAAGLEGISQRPSLRWLVLAGAGEEGSLQTPNSALLVPQHATFLDRLLYVLAERDLDAQNFRWWPWWTSYIAYALLLAWCAFCLYFLLSWGFVFGNAVVVTWVPMMAISLFVSLALVDPLIHVVRHYIGRAHRRRILRRRLRAATVAALSGQRDPLVFVAAGAEAGRPALAGVLAA